MTTRPVPQRARQLRTCASAVALAIVAGCSSPPPPQAPRPAPPPVVEAPPPPPPVAVYVPPPPVAPPAEVYEKVSAATTALAYRRDAAGHLYAKNGDRVYRGKMPPLLYAIGVLEVDVDRGGRIISTNWLRAPSHAPEVVREIENTVRAASPFPAPLRLGRVTYTETWLWHKSGKFQLDTLTEGQL